MTEAKYNQLTKRAAWLRVILQYCQGEEVSASALDDAVKQAKHFHADVLSKIVRYKNKQKDEF